jgi:hypothetical protein
MSSDKGMGLYMPQTFGNLRSNLKEYERLNTNCVNLRLQKYKLEWEIPKLSVKTKKLCLARDGIRAQSILIARSLGLEQKTDSDKRKLEFPNLILDRLESARRIRANWLVNNLTGKIKLLRIYISQ